MPTRHRRVPIAQRSSRQTLRFECLESRALLAADTVAGVISEPDVAGDAAGDDGFACEVVAVALPCVEMPAATAVPWLAYAEQETRGFLVIHMTGTMTDGTPDLRMEIVAMRLNGTESGETAVGVWESEVEIGDSADDATSVVFDAQQTDPVPMPVDAPDLLAAVGDGGSFDWYVVVQSSSDFTLGMMMFVVSLSQTGGESGWSIAGSHDGTAGEVEEPQSWECAAAAAGSDDTTADAFLTADFTTPPVAAARASVASGILDAASLSAISFAASLGTVSPGSMADAARIISPRVGTAAARGDAAVRSSMSAAFGRVGTSRRGEDAVRADRTSLSAGSRTHGRAELVGGIDSVSWVRSARSTGLTESLRSVSGAVGP